MILIVSSFVIFFSIAVSLFLSSYRRSVKWLPAAVIFIISQKYVIYEHVE